MNLVLLRFLWRRHRVATLIFGLAPVLIGLIMGLIYPTYARERALIEAMKIVQSTMKFFSQDKLDMFSAKGSFSITFQDPLILVCYALLPALAPIALYAGDRSRGALDVLLASPLGRGEMLRTVAVFQTLQAVWFSTLAYLGALLAAAVAGEWQSITLGTFLPLAVVAFGVTLAFGGLALLTAVHAESRGRANVVFGVLVFTLLALDVVARMWRAGAWLGWFTPLGYLRPANLLTGEAGFALTLVYYLVPLLAAFAAWWLALVRHRRRLTA